MDATRSMHARRLETMGVCLVLLTERALQLRPRHVDARPVTDRAKQIVALPLSQRELILPELCVLDHLKQLSLSLRCVLNLRLSAA